MINRLLHLYAITFSFILTLGALVSGFAWQNIIATLLFLPVTLYFAYHLVKDLYLRRLRRLYALSHPPTRNRHEVIQSVLTPPTLPVSFRLDAFFAQKNPAFLATVGLYSVIIVVMLFRATLSYLPKPPFVSPVPLSQLANTNR